MIKIKNILIFVFAFGVIFTIGYVIYTLNDFQIKYAEDSTELKTIITDSRFLSGYSNDTLKLRTEYLLIKTIRDSTITYEYKSISDSTRNLKVRYLMKNQKLQIEHIEYKKFDENVYQNDADSINWFDRYKMSDPIIDGMSPVIFNEEYGVLAIANPLGPSAFFMDKHNDSLRVIKIMEELY
ncbi:hypothetical protein BC962_3291 [Gillisia mitskevichiae]|uniref:Uncharacterized protein n=1 Tax=Gillisia mitskevichiae TaxID=270921 RepID=A0A495NX85_9FLAO|nr:hypothetical protein [Gillisia mitskevichiae]RKS42477.1 hypothetical protein BC962_3291 [Gillisia mitskevichiae]